MKTLVGAKPKIEKPTALEISINLGSRLSEEDSSVTEKEHAQSSTILLLLRK